MKRRTFILITAGAAAVAVLPAVKYKHGKFTPQDPLLRPDILARFCDEEEICAIGKDYRSQVHLDNEQKALTDLLLTDNEGHKKTSSEKSVISEFIEERVKQDFKANKTVVVNGWIISETEARQCALVSLAI